MFEIFRPQSLSTTYVEKTSLARFVRDASSEEKKRVYKRVILKATAEQNEVLRAAALRTKRQEPTGSVESCAP